MVDPLTVEFFLPNERQVPHAAGSKRRVSRRSSPSDDSETCQMSVPWTRIYASLNMLV